jgi:myo-inositol-1(or 4)-monophosphatase
VDNCGLFVDTKQNLKSSLGQVMLHYKGRIDDLVRMHPSAPVTLKADASPVTELDLKLSALFEDILSIEAPQICFYSEEKHSDWKFPLAALDPLDGTREYIEGRPEWALSLGIFNDENFQGEGWVYNPLTQEWYVGSQAPSLRPKNIYVGEVSRTEWNENLFSLKSPEFSLQPMGSIAYKLGRLAAGQSDFVVSLRPKNIWDIAGGSLLCQSAGVLFYSEGKLVTKVKPTYAPPLIWCQEQLSAKLLKIFS